MNGNIENGEPSIEAQIKTEISRFGNKDQIIETLRSGEVEIVGDIDELYPGKIDEHINKIDIIDINHPINETLPALVTLNGQKIRCIFKPFDGEAPKAENEFDVEKFYPQEAFAYQVSEHFRLDLVPPTVVREVDGRIGALQLFINPEEYLAFSIIDNKVAADESNQAWEKISKSDDFKKIALLDFILLLADLHNGNWLSKCSEDSGELHFDASDDQSDPLMIAIDHGDCMSVKDYLHFETKGPAKVLTYKDKPIIEPIPKNLLVLLRDGLNRREQFTDSLGSDIEMDPVKISYMWQRVKALISLGHFLSLYNISTIKNRLPESSLEEPRHPDFLLYI